MTVSAVHREMGLWETFEDRREALVRQFEQGFPPDSGLPPEALEAEVRAFDAAHPGMPRVLRKAHAFRIVVSRGQVRVDPYDWFAGTLNHGGVLRRLNARWLHEAEQGAVRDEAAWFDLTERVGAVRGGLDTGHISPGWENTYRGGLLGLLERVAQARATAGDGATEGQRAFWEAVEIVYRATIALAERFASAAEGMGADCAPADRCRLALVAAACRRVPAQAPRTFQEALQFAWLMHELIELEGENVRSMGHFDRVYYPYYRDDLAAGRLTRDQARELIQFLWVKYYARTRGVHNGKNYLFGGQDAQGRAIANDLTYLALEAYERLNTPDPKLSVRYTPSTPRRLYTRVADLIRTGHNSFVLMNDAPAIEGLLRRGKPLEDARTYLPIGCYEPAVDGKEAACTMNIIINIAKPLEYALSDGVDRLSGERVGISTGDPLRFRAWEDLYSAYAVQLGYLLERAAAGVRAHERAWPEINPSPLIACTIDDCIARGRDIGQGGARYNAVGCVGLGLANACDGLLALRQVVFDEQRFSMAEVLEALDADYEGHEVLRSYLLNRVPKWGNGHPEADALARRIADHYSAIVNALPNARGGTLQAALFSLTHQWSFGERTAALPDGRRARETLAPNAGPMPGRDSAGVTALLSSLAGLDYAELPNGSVLDVMLHPTAVAGDEGLEAFADLIASYFRMGGYALQFNVVDRETLLAAQERPEEYATLQVRVTGWSVYWTTLTPYEQAQFIRRTFHAAR